MLRIGVLGGMMDPIHMGHIAAARAALNAGMDQVLLMPCQTPAHRPQPLAPAQHRLALCRIAAAQVEGLAVSDLEMRSETCYTVDTLRALRRLYPEASLSWIIGADKLPSLHHWHGAEEIFSLCDFLVCPRPDSDAQYAVPGARLRLLHVEPLRASSAEAVNALRRYDDAAELLPRAVARYIAENSLYQPDYIPVLRQYGMKDKRLTHTLGVRQTAVALADRYGASMQAAGVAAMLHDIAKPLPLERMQALAREYRLTLPRDVMESANLLHGPLAAAIAEYALGIADQQVLSAIACHTAGKIGMSTLDKVLYIADAIEPNRADYPGLSEIRALADHDLNAAVLRSMERTREYVLARGLPFSEQSQSILEDMKKQKEATT